MAGEESLLGEAATVAISVNNLGGQDLAQLSVPAASTVLHLRQLVSERCGVKLGWTKLLFEQQFLRDDEQKLDEAGVGDGADLTLVADDLSFEIARASPLFSIGEPDEEGVVEVIKRDNPRNLSSLLFPDRGDVTPGSRRSMRFTMPTVLGSPCAGVTHTPPSAWEELDMAFGEESIWHYNDVAIFNNEGTVFVASAEISACSERRWKAEDRLTVDLDLREEPCVHFLLERRRAEAPEQPEVWVSVMREKVALPAGTRPWFLLFCQWGFGTMVRFEPLC